MAIAGRPAAFSFISHKEKVLLSFPVVVPVPKETTPLVTLVVEPSIVQLLKVLLDASAARLMVVAPAAVLVF